MNKSTVTEQASNNFAGKGPRARAPRQLSDKTVCAVAQMSRSMEGLSHAERLDALKMLLSLEGMHPTPIGVGVERKASGNQNDSSGGGMAKANSSVTAKPKPQQPKAAWKNDKRYMEMVDQHLTIVSLIKKESNPEAIASIRVQLRTLEDQMKTYKNTLVGNGLGAGN